MSAPWYTSAPGACGWNRVAGTQFQLSVEIHSQPRSDGSHGLLMRLTSLLRFKGRFRHGLATMLRQKGVDIKTAQELLRHANSRITLDIYQQAMSEEKRVAAGLAFQGLFETSDSQHPRRQHERRGHYRKLFVLSKIW